MCSQTFLTRKLTKNFGLCYNSTYLFFYFFIFFIQGKVRPAKTKLLTAKLLAVLVTFGFSVNLIVDSSSTPRSVSLRESDSAQCYIVTFGISENIWNFSKYHQSSYESYISWKLRFSKIKKFVWLHTVLACAESDSAQSPTLCSVSQFLDLWIFQFPSMHRLCRVKCFVNISANTNF